MTWFRRLVAALCPIAFLRREPLTIVEQKDKAWSGMPVRYRRTYEGKAHTAKIQSLDDWCARHAPEHRKRTA